MNSIKPSRGFVLPWIVVNVELDVKGQQVVVTLDARPGPYACPECEMLRAGYDRKPRRWQYLDTCQFITRGTFRTLQRTELKVARAWTLKERFRQFWDYTYCSGQAQLEFSECHAWKGVGVYH